MAHTQRSIVYGTVHRAQHIRNYRQTPIESEKKTSWRTNTPKHTRNNRNPIYVLSHPLCARRLLLVRLSNIRMLLSMRPHDILRRYYFFCYSIFNASNYFMIAMAAGTAFNSIFIWNYLVLAVFSSNWFLFPICLVLNWFISPEEVFFFEKNTWESNPFWWKSDFDLILKRCTSFKFSCRSEPAQIPKSLPNSMELNPNPLCKIPHRIWPDIKSRTKASQM